MHTSPKSARSQCLARREKRSWSRHRAFFDFAQNEDEFDVPSTTYLILSEVEGRTMPMQCSKMYACHSAAAARTEMKNALEPLSAVVRQNDEFRFAPAFRRLPFRKVE